MSTLLLRLLWLSARPVTYKLSFFRSLKKTQRIRILGRHQTIKKRKQQRKKKKLKLAPKIKTKTIVKCLKHKRHNKVGVKNDMDVYFYGSNDDN